MTSKTREQSRTQPPRKALRQCLHGRRGVYFRRYLATRLRRRQPRGIQSENRLRATRVAGLPAKQGTQRPETKSPMGDMAGKEPCIHGKGRLLQLVPVAAVCKLRKPFSCPAKQASRDRCSGLHTAQGKFACGKRRPIMCPLSDAAFKTTANQSSSLALEACLKVVSKARHSKYSFVFTFNLFGQFSYESAGLHRVLKCSFN